MAVAFGGSLGTPVNDTNSLGTTIALTGVTVPAGARVVINVSWYNPGITVSLAGGSLTWVQEVTLNGTASLNRHVAQYSALAPAGLSSATITATFSDSTYGRGIQGFYMTGVDAGADISTGAAAGDGSSFLAWDAGSVTIASPALLSAFCWYEGNDTTNTPGTADAEITDVHNASNASWVQQYRIETSAATYGATGSWAADGGGEALAVIVAYEESAASEDVFISVDGEWVAADRVTRVSGAWV